MGCMEKRCSVFAGLVFVVENLVWSKSGLTGGAGSSLIQL
jgi:hypothetical protein